MTVTSNIHVGLVAWSNHTFTLAERCSTGGNAYQCITAGTSTSAPTGTSADVDNGGAAHFKWLSAIDYTTIAAWIAGMPGTLTQPVVGLLWNDAIIQGTVGTILFSIDAHVTTTTNTITLKCAPGESWRDRSGAATPLTADSTKGVTIRGAASGGPTSVSYCWVADDNVIIEGIQFVDPYAAGLSQMMIVFNTNFRCEGCIFDGYSNAGPGANLLDLANGSLAYTVVNCLFIDRAASTPQRAISSTDAGTTAGLVEYCTFISTSATASAVSNAATVTNGTVIKACAAFGQTNPFNATGGSNLDMGVSNSVMSAASLANATNVTGNLFSKTAANQFISATVDFRPKFGADLRGVGVADTTNIPLSDDCFRLGRGASGWDAGCCEYNATLPTSMFFG